MPLIRQLNDAFLSQNRFNKWCCRCLKTTPFQTNPLGRHANQSLLNFDSHDNEPVFVFNFLVIGFYDFFGAYTKFTFYFQDK